MGKIILDSIRVEDPDLGGESIEVTCHEHLDVSIFDCIPNKKPEKWNLFLIAYNTRKICQKSKSKNKNN